MAVDIQALFRRWLSPRRSQFPAMTPYCNSGLTGSVPSLGGVFGGQGGSLQLSALKLKLDATLDFSAEVFPQFCFLLSGEVGLN